MAEEIQFQSMDEIRAYIRMEVERQLARDQKKTELWHLAKRTTWLVLLSVAYLQYYLIDIAHQALTLPTLNVNASMSKNPAKMGT